MDVFYAEESPADYLDAAMLSVLQIHMEESSGDILAFLTGQEEIEALAALLNEKARLLPLTYDKVSCRNDQRERFLSLPTISI